MNYAQIRKYDVANGPGVRATVFVSGCTLNCPNCFNKEYQDFNYGSPWTTNIEDNFIKMVKEDDNIRGVTILGGEPLQQGAVLAHLLKRIKIETGKNIWLFTGYTFHYILTLLGNKEPELYDAIYRYVDVVVDGPFVESKKDLRLRFKGSSNQRHIDVKKTFEKGVPVEYVL